MFAEPAGARPPLLERFRMADDEAIFERAIAMRLRRRLPRPCFSWRDAERQREQTGDEQRPRQTHRSTSENEGSRRRYHERHRSELNDTGMSVGVHHMARKIAVSYHWSVQ